MSDHEKALAECRRGLALVAQIKVGNLNGTLGDEIELAAECFRDVERALGLPADDQDISQTPQGAFMSTADDKVIPTRQELHPPFGVNVPGRLRHADMIEVQVKLVPLSYMDGISAASGMRKGEEVVSMVTIARIEARDCRAVGYIARELLRALFREYLGVEI